MIRTTLVLISYAHRQQSVRQPQGMHWFLPSVFCILSLCPISHFQLRDDTVGIVMNSEGFGVSLKVIGLFANFLAVLSFMFSLFSLHNSTHFNTSGLLLII